jgi:hypothetical protein
MIILRKHPNNWCFAKGCHSTLSFVKLLAWLPDNVMEEYLTQFRVLTHVKLLSMVEKHHQTPAPKSHGCIPSLETISNVSIASILPDHTKFLDGHIPIIQETKPSFTWTLILPIHNNMLAFLRGIKVVK